MQIKVELNVDSINRAIKEIEQYKKDLNEKCYKVVNELTQFGYNIMVSRTNTIEYHGHFKEGRGYKVEVVGDKYKGKIFVKDSSAVYVEFGYGLITKGSLGYRGDDDLMAQIGYNPLDPTLDPTLYNGKIDTFVDEDGSVRKTRGQIARSYMYFTSEDVKDYMERIVTNIFNGSKETVQYEEDIPF